MSIDKVNSDGKVKKNQKSVYANILNECLIKTKDDILLHISEEKVSDVLGSDSPEYKHILSEICKSMFLACGKPKRRKKENF